MNSKKVYAFDASQPPPKDFIEYWNFAAQHVYVGICDQFGCLRFAPTPPLFEHLIFVMGNRLFFVYLETDVSPLTKELKEEYVSHCEECGAIPLTLRLRRRGGEIELVDGGTGLTHTTEGHHVYPQEYIDDELIVMTEWEVQDCVSKMLAEQIEKDGGKIYSRVTYVGLNPAMWYQKDGQSYCVILKTAAQNFEGTVKKPEVSDEDHILKKAIKHKMPEAITMIVCALMSTGQEDRLGEPPYRGLLLQVDTDGLEELT